MEQFAFPFWMDIVIEPLCHWEEKWTFAGFFGGSRVYQLPINPRIINKTSNSNTTVFRMGRGRPEVDRKWYLAVSSSSSSVYKAEYVETYMM